MQPEKSSARATAPAARAAKFPTTLAVAGIVATGAGLVASGINVRWGAATPSYDGLGYSWVYVNIALAWTWLLVWPAVGLRRARFGRSTLAWDLGVLAAAAVPAMTVAAFLSGATASMIGLMIALQAGLGIMTMGALSQRNRLGPGAIAAALASVAVVLPVIGYVWAEFFPMAGQGWRAFIPVVAVTRLAARNSTGGAWWMACVYAAIGILLFVSSPRASKPTPLAIKN